MNDQQIMDEAGRIQGQDKSAARRMLKMVTNTEEVAANTMETMKNQTDQLSRIHQDLEEIDDTLKMASAQIKKFMRKQATDKVIMAFLFMIIMGVVVIMVRQPSPLSASCRLLLPACLPSIHLSIHLIPSSTRRAAGRLLFRWLWLQAAVTFGAPAR